MYRRLRDMAYIITEKTISVVHVLPGSGETLVRRGGITNRRSIVYSLGNISAKNYHNPFRPLLFASAFDNKIDA